MTLPIILLIAVNLVNGDTYYEQYKTMNVCLQAQAVELQNIKENKYPAFIVPCAEYDIELEDA